MKPRHTLNNSGNLGDLGISSISNSANGSVSPIDSINPANSSSLNTSINPVAPNNSGKKTRHIMAALLSAFALAAMLVLAGCVPAPNAGNDAKNSEPEPPTMSQYMVSLNESANKLQTALTEFSSAVNSNDTYLMSLKADEAYAVMDQMDAIECPPELNDVKGKYKDAISELKTALSDYLALYIDIDKAEAPSQQDYDAYNGRLEEIQKHYDEGLNLLDEADEMVAKSGAKSDADAS